MYICWLWNKLVAKDPMCLYADFETNQWKKVQYQIYQFDNFESCKEDSGAPNQEISQSKNKMYFSRIQFFRDALLLEMIDKHEWYWWNDKKSIIILLSGIVLCILE